VQRPRVRAGGRARHAMRLDSAHNAPPHLASYALHRSGRAVARLDWLALPHAGAGWHLRRLGRPARPLAVDIALDARADDTLEDVQRWQEWAQVAEALSLPLALDAADRALRGGLPPAPSRPLPPGIYELHITGLDPSTLALACPSMRVSRAGDTSVIDGVVDDDGMGRLIRRVNLLGARVLAIFREHGEHTAA
jgi:hypothetical protein